MSDSSGLLSPRQHELLDGWLPGAEVVRDHSWGLVGTVVLELLHEGERYIAKAGDERDHHLARELRAHQCWLGPWVERGRAPVLVQADAEAKLLLTRYLPGVLVQGTEHEQDPDVYRQAGELLALLHAQPGQRDPDYEKRMNDRALAWLDGPHRIPAATEARLRADIGAWPTPPAVTAPTHGDWQPRNWLVHDGVVSVIDLGRADLRPAMTDLARLSAQQFRGRPDLEAAFLTGYGADPREPAAWRRERVREAIGTAAWAFRVGDEAFEQQGLRMIEDVLDDLCTDR